MWEILLPPAVEVKSLLFHSLTNAGYCQTLKFMPVWWVWNRALFSIYFSFIAVEHLFICLLVSLFSFCINCLLLTFMYLLFCWIIFSYWFLKFHMRSLLIFCCLCELQIYILVCCFFLFFFLCCLLLLRRLKFQFSNIVFLLWFYFSCSRKAFSPPVRILLCFLLKVLLKFWFSQLGL